MVYYKLRVTRKSNQLNGSSIGTNKPTTLRGPNNSYRGLASDATHFREAPYNLFQKLLALI